MILDGRILNPLEVARGAYGIGETAVDLGLMVSMFVSLGLVEINSNPLTRLASRKLTRTYLPMDLIKGLGYIEDIPDNVIPICDAVSDLQLAA